MVVRENIVRHAALGKDHKQAALEGTREIGLAGTGNHPNHSGGIFTRRLYGWHYRAIFINLVWLFLVRCYCPCW